MIVPVADLLPFVPHFERLSKQSTLNIFVDAVQKGVEKATRKGERASLGFVHGRKCMLSCNRVLRVTRH
jgi:hypothetical protein